MEVLPYLLIALLVLVQGGELGIILAGYYVHLDRVELVAALPLIVVCMVAGDAVWYYHGCKLYRLPFIRRAEPWLRHMDRYIERRPLVVALVARLSYGLHYLVIARYRGSAVPPHTFFKIMLLTSVTWVLFAGGAVFSLAEYLPKTKGVFNNLELIFTGTFLLFVLFECTLKTALKRYLKRLDLNDG